PPRGARAGAGRARAARGRPARPLAACGPDELWRGLLDLALTELRQVRQLADRAEARLDQLARQSAEVQLLQTTPGVGPRTAEAIVAYLHDPGRFQSGKQVSAYVGQIGRASCRERRERKEERSARETTNERRTRTSD